MSRNCWILRVVTAERWLLSLNYGICMHSLFEWKGAESGSAGASGERPGRNGRVPALQRLSSSFNGWAGAPSAASVDHVTANTHLQARYIDSGFGKKKMSLYIKNGRSSGTSYFKVVFNALRLWVKYSWCCSLNELSYTPLPVWELNSSNLVTKTTFESVHLFCVAEGGSQIKMRAISLSATQMQLKLGPHGSSKWTRSGYWIEFKGCLIAFLLSHSAGSNQAEMLHSVKCLLGSCALRSATVNLFLGNAGRWK
jgi:hypothetical protein